MEKQNIIVGKSFDFALHVREATQGQSRADFIDKSETLQGEDMSSLQKGCEEPIKILTAIVKTTRSS